MGGNDRQIMTDLLRATEGSAQAATHHQSGTKSNAIGCIDYALANLKHAKQLLTEKE